MEHEDKFLRVRLEQISNLLDSEISLRQKLVKKLLEMKKLSRANFRKKERERLEEIKRLLKEMRDYVC